MGSQTLKFSFLTLYLCLVEHYGYEIVYGDLICPGDDARLFGILKNFKLADFWGV